MKKIAVFLAEGENHVRRTLRLILEQQNLVSIAGEANHAESLLAQVCQHPPDTILLDWTLPGLRPQRLIPAIRRHCPKTLILVTSTQSEYKKVVNKYGVDGFLLKQLPPDQFLRKLEELLEGTSKENKEE